MFVIKTFIKYCLTGLGLVLTLPLSLPAILERVTTGSKLFFYLGTHLLALVPSHVGNYLRAGYYVVTLKKFHPTAVVGFCSLFSNPDAIMHERSGMGAFCVMGNVEINANVRIASRVSIISGLHQHGTSMNREENGNSHVLFKRVVIGDSCWIGEGAIIADDVGANSIIALGSVVSKPIPEWSLAMGNPARIISDLRPKPETTD